VAAVFSLWVGGGVVAGLTVTAVRPGEAVLLSGSGVRLRSSLARLSVPAPRMAPAALAPGPGPVVSRRRRGTPPSQILPPGLLPPLLVPWLQAEEKGKENPNGVGGSGSEGFDTTPAFEARRCEG
jgi:hypothetical protein